jgi:signal transduction histidine kinase
MPVRFVAATRPVSVSVRARTGCQHGGGDCPGSPYASRVTWPRGLTVGVAALTAATLLAAAALFSASPSVHNGLLLAAAVVVGGAPVSAGVWVSRRYPSNALGPLLVLPGLFAALAVVGLFPAVARWTPPGEDYVTAASQGDWVLVYVVLAVPLLLFPGGRATARLGRWLLAVILADAALFLVIAATAPGPFLPPDQTSPHVLGTMPATLSNVLSAISLTVLPLTLVGLGVHLVRSYRASDDHRRGQFRWLALVGALLPVTLLSTWFSYAVIGNAEVVLAVGLAAMYLAVPTVIALAVVRPKLFDVDRVLAGTASHATLTAMLLAVFTGANLIAGQVFSQNAPTIAVAATALVALALTPVRGRLQRSVDRWLYPARKAAYAAVDELYQETMAGLGGPEQLQARLRRALHDQNLLVAYRGPSDGVLADADGTPMDGYLAGHQTSVDLGGQSIGVLVSRRDFSVELMRDIASRAAPLVELVRLRVDLRRALKEAELSRARLLRVGYDERARLERDLHDGAQQRLVALGMALRLAQRRLPSGVDVSGVLDAAVAQIGTAVNELRQVAHGIRPSCLDDGLVPALSSLVSSTPIPVTLEVTASQLEPDVETTAYYVAAEAITNAVKHADARQITLRVEVGDGELHVRIIDDGVGDAAPHEGSGLAGLADRVGAQGGRLAIHSPRGHGTIVEAVLPCASS